MIDFVSLFQIAEKTRAFQTGCTRTSTAPLPGAGAGGLTSSPLSGKASCQWSRSPSAGREGPCPGYFLLSLPSPTFPCKTLLLGYPNISLFYLQPLVSSRPSHDSTCANLLEQRFSNLTACQNHLESIFKHRPPEFLIQ